MNLWQKIRIFTQVIALVCAAGLILFLACDAWGTARRAAGVSLLPARVIISAIAAGLTIYAFLGMRKAWAVRYNLPFVLLLSISAYIESHIATEIISVYERTLCANAQIAPTVQYYADDVDRRGRGLGAMTRAQRQAYIACPGEQLPNEPPMSR